jgi:predicted nucleic acid-binding protein
VIVLDTNVLSALMQASPEPMVVRWLDAQPASSVWLTSVTLFEARYGIELLPAGRRRAQLTLLLEGMLTDQLGGRVADFDADAAAATAMLAAARHRVGRPVGVRDTLIAGIVTSRRATLATRNVRDFADLDVPVVDPWAFRSRPKRR